MSDCNETHIGTARVFATQKVAYAPVAMGEDYALRASRSIIGTQSPLINQLNGPMMDLYTSRAQPELLEGFQPRTDQLYNPLTLSTGYSCQRDRYSKLL